MKTLTLHYFGAVWCGPCRIQKKVLAKVEEAHPDLTVVKHDADNEKDCALYEEMTGKELVSVPAMVITRGKGEKEKVLFDEVGTVSRATLEEFLKDNTDTKASR